MGIAGGHNVTHSVGGLSIMQLYASLWARKTHERQRPMIDFDASWLARSSFGRSTLPAQIIISLAEAFCLAGFDVTVVTDPQLRHHSKRASHKRIAERQQALITAKYLKTEIVSTKSRLKGTDSVSSKEDLRKAHATLVKNSTRYRMQVLVQCWTNLKLEPKISRRRRAYPIRRT
jgi:hypothetical protein